MYIIYEFIVFMFSINPLRENCAHHIKLGSKISKKDYLYITRIFYYGKKHDSLAFISLTICSGVISTKHFFISFNLHLVSPCLLHG